MAFLATFKLRSFSEANSNYCQSCPPTAAPSLCFKLLKLLGQIVKLCSDYNPIYIPMWAHPINMYVTWVSSAMGCHLRKVCGPMEIIIPHKNWTSRLDRWKVIIWKIVSDESAKTVKRDSRSCITALLYYFTI